LLSGKGVWIKVRVLKRIFDLILATPAMVILSPVLLIIYIINAILLGNPAIYRQIRPGLHGKPFCILKFRTMTDARDAEGVLLPDGARLRSFGRFLRSTSLDELPELFNILKGEMSIVGPRPLLMQYLPRYSLEQARRHEVKPGLTGWAQVNGRNAINWEDRFQLDTWYVDNWSLILDIKIILLTILKILKREGIRQEGQATMSEFMGSHKSKASKAIH
jgi:sugar transferase EpsL